MPRCAHHAHANQNFFVRLPALAAFLSQLETKKPKDNPTSSSTTLVVQRTDEIIHISGRSVRLRRGARGPYCLALTEIALIVLAITDSVRHRRHRAAVAASRRRPQIIICAKETHMMHV